MRPIAIITGGLVASFALAGCEQQPRSVSYFQENAQDRIAVVAACRVGDQRGDECANAAKASELEATQLRRERTIDTLEKKINGDRAK